MKAFSTLLLAAGATAASGAAIAAEAVTLDSEAALSQYWLFDAGTTFPLLDAAGNATVVPTDVARKAGKWEKTYAVKIDSTGKVTSAICVDCAAGDAVAPIIQKTILLNRFKPAPGNPKRLGVEVPMHMSLTPPRI